MSYFTCYAVGGEWRSGANNTWTILFLQNTMLDKYSQGVRLNFMSSEKPWTNI